MREEEVEEEEDTGGREGVLSEAPCLSVLRMYCAAGKCHLMCLSYNSHSQRRTRINAHGNIKQHKPFVHAALNHSYVAVRFSSLAYLLQRFLHSPL